MTRTATTERDDPVAIEVLLASLGPAEQMHAFYESRLGPLREYDRAHGAHLIQTLDAYFAAGRSLSAAAARLRTHRNTVLYRLRRIEELVQAKLRDPQVDLELQVALRIAAALRK
ncbi:MAG: PucR family transcriptional regulator [Chloroflexota bacterium]